VSATASITDRFRGGDRSALSRLISWAERGDPRFPAALSEVYGGVGRAWRVGVTGPPGAGKSTLVNELTKLLRARDQSVGILAVDPSSPFTGGALLGDRIRMEERTLDEGVYIRSMASRSSHGGLARAAADACDVMDAFGLGTIMLETVGVGQAEYDVVAAADTVLVVLCPGAGDGIQAMKAGILEVADVLVVNKADLDGADRLMADLSEAVHTRGIRREDDQTRWEPPVVAAVAARGEGAALVLDAVERHREHRSTGDAEGVRRRKRLAQVRRVVDERLDEELWRNGTLVDRAESALRGGATPYDVAEEILAAIPALWSRAR
jgi:LAO/AO transport system kinase